MKELIKILAFFSFLLVMFSCAQKEISCTLSGEVIGRDSDTILLMKATEHRDEDPEMTLIPIKNGKFKYTFNPQYSEAYVLAFKDDREEGNPQSFLFFAEDGLIFFKLHSKNDYNLNEIKGGELTKGYYDFRKLEEETYKQQEKSINDSMDALMDRDDYFSPEFKLQQEKLKVAMKKLEKDDFTEEEHEIAMTETQVLQKMTEKGDYATPKGKILNNKIDSITVASHKWHLNYIADNPTVVSYYLLINNIKNLQYTKGVNIADINTVIPKFHEKYPNHPYTTLTRNMLTEIELIQPGNKYIDFSAPDLDNKIHKLSDVIQGKYAVIDFWATTCGSCIVGSRELLPIYEEYKDKNFTVCGIAREYKDTDALVRRIEREKFTWTNLVELDDKNQIWSKYGIQTLGRKILVDDKGIILAIDPSVDQIREILDGRLK